VRRVPPAFEHLSHPSKGVCGACARWQFYLHLDGEKRGAIRARETKRWRAGSLQRA
jgi:hypothetical protein